MAPEDETTPEKPEISYPAEWGYRVVCSSEEEVRAHLLEILGQVEHELSAGNVSSSGKYVTLNLKLVVNDEAHRLRIYEQLTGHDAVRLVL
jgi:putative lipoic acid-binding regulatory protein